MRVTILINLALAAVTISAAAVPEHVSAVRTRADGGFSLQMRKRSISNALEKRGPFAHVNDRWWITLDVGSNPPQALNFLPDTGSNTFSVGSTLLPANERGNALYYNPNASSSAVQLQGYTYAEYFSGYSDSGVVFNETFTIADTSMTSVPFCVQTQASSPTENDRSGNLGLNRDYGGQSTSPTRLPSFMQAIKGNLPNWLFTTSYNLYTNTGELDFGYIDSSKYTGTLTYSQATSSGQWYTYFSGLIINGTQQNFSFQVLIDTGGGGATLPQNALNAYFATVPGATFNSQQNTYVFPCNTTIPNLTFVVNGLKLTVPTVSWVSGVLGSTAQCTSRFTLSSDAGAYLGDAFIDGVFLVFDLGNDRIGFANRPAITQTLPSDAISETIDLFQQKNFGGTLVKLNWVTSSCHSLQNTAVYHNVTSFLAPHGSCTFYSDNGCSSPIAGATELYDYSLNTGTTLSAGSFMCLDPEYYQPTGSGEMQYCYGPQFTNNCRTDQWKSFVCNPLPSNYVNKIGSAGPYPGYCTWYTDAACANPIQGDAVMPYPGETITPWGNKVASYMCI